MEIGKKSGLCLGLRTAVLSVLAASLIVSSAVFRVSAAENAVSPADTVSVETSATDGTSKGSVKVESGRMETTPNLLTMTPSELVEITSGHFKPNATYNGSFGSELLADEKLFYDALVQSYITEGKNEPITVDLTGRGYANASSDEKLTDVICSASAAFTFDYPELYWIRAFRWSTFRDSDGNVSVGLSYPEEAYTDAYANRDTVESGIQSAMATITAQRKSASRYDTIKAIHDYICRNASYDHDAVEYGTTSGEYGGAWTAAPLFGGSTRGQTFVCEGYSKAFKVLCGRFDIPTTLVVGLGSGEAHMWNYAQMDDGNWYGVDVTWDDQDSRIEYNYFLCGKNSSGFYQKFSADHVPSGQIYGDDLYYPMVFPQLSNEAYDPQTVVNSVELNQHTMSLDGDQAMSLSVTIDPDDYVGPVTWTSSNTSVATVKNGLVTGKGVGTAVITVKAGGKSDTCTVTVNKAISLSKYDVTLTKTHSTPAPYVTLVSKIVGSTTGKKWVSSDPDVASVDQNGKVTAVGQGTAQITCVTTSDGVSSRPCVVTVDTFYIQDDPDAAYPEHLSAVYPLVGGNVNVLVKNTAHGDITWSVSNTRYATVDASGKVTGATMTPNSTIVRVKATAADGTQDELRVIVVKPTSQITLTPSEYRLAVGEKVTIKATVDSGSNDIPKTWYFLGGAEVAESERDGSTPLQQTIVGRGNGTFQVSADTYSGQHAVATITVYTKATGIQFTKKAESISVTDENPAEIAVQLTPADCGDTVTWTSSNNAIVTVEGSGTSAHIRGLKKGTANITARTGSGKTASYQVTVVSPATGVQITPDKTFLYVNGAVALKAALTPADSNDIVTWSSGNPDIATVDSTGKVKALAPGTARITATATSGVSHTAEVIVGQKATGVAFTDAVGYNVTTIRSDKAEGYPFVVDVLPAGCNDKLTWTSSSPAIASVTAGDYGTAIVVGHKKGTVTITAKTGSGKFVSRKLTVVVPATAVEVTPNPINVYVGGTATPKIALTPKDSNDTVTWSIFEQQPANGAQTDVISIDKTGKVKALAQGRAIIRATAAMGNVIGETVVNVRSKATAVAFTDVTPAIKVGESYTFKAEITAPAGCNDSVTWTTSSNKIADITYDGNTATVTGVAKGTATITYKTGSGKSVAYKVNVVETPATEFNLNVTSLSLYEKATATLKATILTKDAKKAVSNDVVVWRSGDESVVKVDSTGKVTAVAQGEATITATTCVGQVSKQIPVTVRSKATAIRFDGTFMPALLLCDDPAYSTNVFGVEITAPENCNDTVTWTTSNAKIVKVEQLADHPYQALVTAVAKGTAKITAKTGSGKSVVCSVKVVTVPATKLTVNKTLDLYVGATATPSVTLEPKGSDDVISWWVADIGYSGGYNPLAVKVDENTGKITAVEQGKVRVVASALFGNDVKAVDVDPIEEVIVVTVRTKATAVAFTDVTPAIKVGESYTFKAEITAPAGCNDSVTWTTSNSKIADITYDGNTATVTGVAKGTATITYKTGSGKSVAYKVNVVETPATEFNLNVTSLSLYEKATATLKATILTKDAKKAVSNDVVVWRSGDESVVKVDSTGKVTAVAQGEATITATTCIGQVSKQIPVTVRTKATAIALEQTAVSVQDNKTVTVSVQSLTPAGCNDSVTWTSANKAIATVESDGDGRTAVIKGVKKGTVKITAKTGSGKTAVVTVTVFEGPKVNLTLWGSQADQAFLKERANVWAQQYAQDNPAYSSVSVNVQIKAENVAGDTAMKNPAAAADVYGVANDQISDLVSANAILPMTNEQYYAMADIVGGDAIKSTLYHGKFYGYPYAPNTAEILYYNKSMYTEDEVKNLNTMLGKNLNGGAINLVADIDSSWNSMTWFATAGAQLYTGSDKSVNTMNSASCTAMMQWLLVQMNDGKIVDMDSYTDAAEMLRSRQAGAVMYGAWPADEFRDALGDDFGAVELPCVSVPNSVTEQHLTCFGGSKLLVVNAKSQNSDAAASLAQFITNEESQLIRFEMTGQTPTAFALANDPAFSGDEVTKAEMKQGVYVVTNLSLNSQANYWTYEGNFMYRLHAGTIASGDIQAQLDDMVAHMQSDVGAPGYLYLSVGTIPDEMSLTQTLAEEWKTSFVQAHPEYTHVTVKVVERGVDQANPFGFSTDGKVWEENPDVYTIWNDQLKEYTIYSEAGIAELPADAYSTMTGVVGEDALKSGLYQGKYYGMPYGSNTAEILFYNKSMYTAEEVKNLNTMLSKNLGSGVANLAADIDSAWNSMTWFATAGAELYTGGNKSVNTLNSAKCAAMLKWLNGQLRSGKIVDSDGIYYSDDSDYSQVIWDDTYDDMANLLRSGRTGAVFCGAWAKDYMAEALGDDFGVAELPVVTVPDCVTNAHLKCFGGSKLIVVNRNSFSRNEAFDLALALSGTDAQRRKYTELGMVPVNPSIIAGVANDEVDKAEAAQGLYTLINQPLNGSSDYWSLESVLMSDLVNGKISDSQIQSRLNTMVNKMKSNVAKTV